MPIVLREIDGATAMISTRHLVEQSLNISEDKNWKTPFGERSRTIFGMLETRTDGRAATPFPHFPREMTLTSLRRQEPNASG
jgi:hypothetical protein